MELALSLGDTTPKPFSFLEKSQKILGTDLGFCMAVGKVCGDSENRGGISKTYEDHRRTSSSSDPPPVQLDLLPFSPLHSTHPSSHKLSFPWLTQNLISEQGKRVDQESEEGAISQLSSPNSAISSFQMDFSSAYINSAGNNKRNYNNSHEGEADRGASSRGSDEDENVFARKKLRLSKQQSAFLEDTFKEHNTLNPKEKLNLAKQLNLSPRQVEVWFQNRRARTKLKQTEVDCEYLKRCCETLTEENKRLKKELQELRALKASKPFYMQLPATTLTMCSSCERVAAAAAAATATAAAAPAAANNPNELFSLSTGDAHDE